MKDNIYGKHTLVVGPTGTGKTMRVILPYVLNAIAQDETFIVADGKNKLLNKVYKNMQDKGYNVVTINMRNPEESCSWNPLWEPYQYYLEKDMDNCLDMLNDLAANIMLNKIPGEKSDPFWEISAKNMFVGLALALFEENNIDKKMINLKSIYYMSTKGFEKLGANTYMHQYFKYKSENSPSVINMASVLNAPNETRGSILSVFYQKLSSFIAKESFWEKLCINEIDLKQISTSKTGVFLTYEDEKVETTGLIDVFVKQLFQTYIRRKEEDNRIDMPKCHLILDDFNSFSYFRGLENMLLASRERDISMLFSVNSMSLLKRTYGKDWVSFLYNNCNKWVIFRNTELKFMKKFIKQLELFYGIERFPIERLVEKEGLAIVVRDNGKVALEELSIPKYVENMYHKEKQIENYEYSVFKVDEYVREEMQTELNGRIGREEDVPAFNVDELIAKIDKKIEELEKEERKEKEKKSQEEEKKKLVIEKMDEERHSEEVERGGLFEKYNSLGKNKFVVYSEIQKKEVEMDILFTFESEETKKKYIVYTDNTEDEKGNIRVYSNVMVEDEKGVKLEPIATEKEYKVVEIMLGQIQDEVHRNLNE